MKKKSIKKKGALRARAASVRVTLLLRMIIEAIRTASEESQKQQRLEAQSLVYRTRARSDSRNSMSSDSGAIHSSGKYFKRRERASRNESTVVNISIESPSIKPVALSFSRSPLF